MKWSRLKFLYLEICIIRQKEKSEIWKTMKTGLETNYNSKKTAHVDKKKKKKKRKTKKTDGETHCNSKKICIGRQKKIN